MQESPPPDLTSEARRVSRHHFHRRTLDPCSACCRSALLGQVLEVHRHLSFTSFPRIVTTQRSLLDRRCVDRDFELLDQLPHRLPDLLLVIVSQSWYHPRVKESSPHQVRSPTTIVLPVIVLCLISRRKDPILIVSRPSIETVTHRLEQAFRNHKEIQIGPGIKWLSQGLWC